MKVDAFRLYNFMAFEETDWIELRPINLLFGKNSSGKSALIRALLLLKQSLHTRGEDGPLTFIVENGLVNLANFGETLHGHKEDSSMVFGFRCDLTGDSLADDIKNLIRINITNDSFFKEAIDAIPKSAELLIGFGQYGSSQHRANLLRLDVRVGENIINLVDCVRPDDQSVDMDHALNSDIIHDHDMLDASIGLHLREKTGFWTTFAKYDRMNTSFRKADDILLKIQTGIGEFLEKIVHVGPLRPQPERTYILHSIEKARYIRNGLSGWWEFLSSNIQSADKAEEIERWMVNLGLSKEVEVKRRISSDVITSQVFVNNSHIEVNLKDVGFGASQVLPVVTASVLSQLGNLIIIEQPELHLHQEAQASLADLFVDLAQLGVQFILETHSEHFLLRFQRRVAESFLEAKSPDSIHPRNEGHTLSNEAISVQFITRDQGISSVEHIGFDKAGRLFAQDKNNHESDTSETFNRFFRTDYEDARLLGRAMSEILSQTKS